MGILSAYLNFKGDLATYSDARGAFSEIIIGLPLLCTCRPYIHYLLSLIIDSLLLLAVVLARSHAYSTYTQIAQDVYTCCYPKW
ncbi:hypothetical protein BDV40DRAFT_276413 [Aspergillus tamarii]|uniref:Uncharacterized protein n=1 Tax=Aspergillus tamarii TaxID=41984 RepID=A0A5N6UHX9_ASPTM|nr:hypothetical protein BDV40DRAFT_276413 [Aspergillus tamarii]